MLGQIYFEVRKEIIYIIIIILIILINYWALFKITTCLNNIFGLLNNMLGHA
jgi:hypothetical protein